MCRPSRPRTRSFPDFIRSGVDGVLVDPSSAPALAEAMAGLLARPERALALGATPAAPTRSAYRPEAVTAQLVERYEGAIRRRHGGGHPALAVVADPRIRPPQPTGSRPPRRSRPRHGRHGARAEPTR